MTYMVDFSTYQPPGVYVEETLSSVINLVGVRPGVLAIVGPSRGYREGNETIPLTEDAGVGVPFALAEEGIDTDSIRVFYNGTELTLDTDYAVVETGSGPTSTHTVAGIFNDPDDSIGEQTSVFDEGDTPDVQVSYQYTDEGYYDPQRFTDFDEVQDFYGPALNVAAGTINSALSFAARFAFQNGAREVVLVSITESAVTEDLLEAAYAKLLADEFADVSIVVPLLVGLTTPSTAIGELSVVLANHATEGMFRVGIVGVDTVNTETATSLASAGHSPRVVLAWPNALHYFDGYNNQTIEIGGQYLAAAYAGRLISLQSQIPLTRKRIYGFSGFPASVSQTMSRSNKDNWSSNGVAVTEIDRQGQMIVRHGVTTSTVNIHEREISLVRARDTLINLLQETVDGSGLIGTFIDDDAPGRVKGVVAGVLELALTNGVVAGYQNLKARQLTSDPSVIEVKFQYRPSYPLNYIVISFSINTSTGETTLIEQATGV